MPTDAVAKSGIRIRLLKEADCPRTVRFIARTMTWAWQTYGREVVTPAALAQWIALRRRSLRAGLKDPNAFCFVAVKGGRILGIALGEAEFGVATIDWLAVDPDHQGRGLGRRLVETAERHARRRGCHKLTLVTYPALLPAINLYLTCGMIPEAFLRRHALEEDYIVMSKWLRPAREGRSPRSAHFHRDA